MTAASDKADELLNTPAWDASKTYATGDLVTASGNLYQSAVDSNTGNDPASDTTHWTKIGAFSTVAGGLGSTATSLSSTQQTVSSQGDDITANTSAIGKLGALTTDGSAFVLN